MSPYDIDMYKNFIFWEKLYAKCQLPKRDNFSCSSSRWLQFFLLYPILPTTLRHFNEDHSPDIIGETFFCAKENLITEVTRNWNCVLCLWYKTAMTHPCLRANVNIDNMWVTRVYHVHMSHVCRYVISQEWAISNQINICIIHLIAMSYIQFFKAGLALLLLK